MREVIQVGAIFFRDSTLFPGGSAFETEQFSPGWRSVKGLDGSPIDRKKLEAGWTFFYLAGESRATAFGVEGQKTARRAIRKILEVQLRRGHIRRLQGIPGDAVHDGFVPLA